MADVTAQTTEPNGRESPPPAPSSNALRCLEILSADKDRLGGHLPPARADSLFEKRALSASERAWVYTQLAIADPNQTEEASDVLLDGEDYVEADAQNISSSRAVADPVDFLLNAAQRFPLLNGEEEKLLGRLVLNALRLQQAVDADEMAPDPQVLAAMRRGQSAHTKLVLSNLRLVVSIANEFRRRTSLEMSDLVQDGIIGLMRAVEGYDPELGHRFSTYASYWIKQSIGRAIDNTGRTIRIPVHMLATISKLRKATRRLEAETLKSPGVSRLADELGWDRETTEEVLALSVMTVVSTDDEGDDDEPKRPILVVDQAPSPQEVLESKELSAILENLIAELPDRQGEVIRRRFGFESKGGQEETLEQIGSDFGVTRERIRQIEAKALERLRHPIRARRLSSYRSDR